MGATGYDDPPSSICFGLSFSFWVVMVVAVWIYLTQYIPNTQAEGFTCSFPKPLIYPTHASGAWRAYFRIPYYKHLLNLGDECKFGRWDSSKPNLHTPIVSMYLGISTYILGFACSVVGTNTTYSSNVGEQWWLNLVESLKTSPTKTNQHVCLIFFTFVNADINDAIVLWIPFNKKNLRTTRATKKKHYYFPLWYWLFNRDSYNGIQ